MVKSEIYKLFKYKAFWIVFLLQIGLSTLLTFIDTPKTVETVKNIIACGIRRSTVFRAKLIVSFLAALLLLAADGAIRVIIAFVKGATLGGELIPLIIAIALQVLMVLLYACIFFSFSYLLYKGPWGMLISLYFVLFSTFTMAMADFFLKLPVTLSNYTVAHLSTVAHNLVFNLDTLLPVLIVTLLVCGLTILVYAVTAKREIR